MITVFGSINLDLVVSVPRLPGAGETVIGPGHESFPGGKGGNQAVAAAKAGAAVRMVGAVGRDRFADLALADLIGAGVSLEHVRRLDEATGIALIGVDQTGENQIIVASGANASVRAEWLDGLLDSETVLLMQGEIAADQIARAIEMAKKASARIVWNPAPVPPGNAVNLAQAVDVLIVNQVEASELAALLDLPTEPGAFVSALAAAGVLVIVTLGGDGVLAAAEGSLYRYEPPDVAVCDTTGAGDAFCGALAAALDAGAAVDTALREAVAAGTLACSLPGAQSSSPLKTEIKATAAAVHCLA